MSGQYGQRLIAVALLGAAVGALVTFEDETALRLAQLGFMGGLLWLKAAP